MAAGADPMNRLRRWWDNYWIDALIVIAVICMAGAIAELAFLWATTP